jgi:hypothetical protein
MKVIRVVIITLAVLHLAFTGFTGMVGLFADGGTIWERLLVSGLHPIAAIALLAVLLAPRSGYRWPAWVALAFPVASIVGDMALYLAISSGATKGDASLALAFAVIPALGLIYAFLRGMGQNRSPGPGLGGGESMYQEQTTDPVRTEWFRDVDRRGR